MYIMTIVPECKVDNNNIICVFPLLFLAWWAGCMFSLRSPESVLATWYDALAKVAVSLDTAVTHSALCQSRADLHSILQRGDRQGGQHPCHVPTYHHPVLVFLLTHIFNLECYTSSYICMPLLN